MSLFANDRNFLSRYLNLLTSRFTTASIKFESDFESSDFRNAMMFESSMEALNYIFLEDFGKLRLDVICNVAELLEPDVNDKGFRRTSIEVKNSNIERSNPKDIYYHMYALLDNYYNIWDGLDPYLREAYFHIRFLHIHPFEDGNGRTARVLSAYNLIYNYGLAPAILQAQDKTNYNSFIENSDYESMAKLFKQLSEDEEIVARQLYEKYEDSPLIYKLSQNI